MKKQLSVLAAAAIAASASMASAQSIAPECATAAANAGVVQGYDVVFDRASGNCVATPLGEPVVSSQAEAAPLGGLLGTQTGLIIAGVAAAGFSLLVIDRSDSTGGT